MSRAMVHAVGKLRLAATISKYSQPIAIFRGFSTTADDGDQDGRGDSGDDGRAGGSGAALHPPPRRPSPITPTPQRVWLSSPSVLPGDPSFDSTPPIGDGVAGGIGSGDASAKFWTDAVDDGPARSVRALLDRVADQERQGGRMRESQLGVVRTDVSVFVARGNGS